MASLLSRRRAKSYRKLRLIALSFSAETRVSLKPFRVSRICCSMSLMSEAFLHAGDDAEQIGIDVIGVVGCEHVDLLLLNYQALIQVGVGGEAEEADEVQRCRVLFRIRVGGTAIGDFDPWKGGRRPIDLRLTGRGLRWLDWDCGLVGCRASNRPNIFRPALWTPSDSMSPAMMMVVYSGR